MRLTACRGPGVLLLMLALGGVCGAAPVIQDLRVLTPQVPRYGRFELAAEITGDWANPFDPDQISVDATVTSPGGGRLRVPGFWFQDFAESGPATRARQQVTGLTLFVYAHEWPEGAKLDLFVDDVCLLDERGREVPFDDMERGDAPRAQGVDGATLSFTDELSHGGTRSLRLTPTLAGGQHWPAALYKPDADWSRYKGVVYWVYPRCDSPLSPLRSYTLDEEWGKSRMAVWEPRNGTLRANCWNRLEAVWPEPWPPVNLTPRGKPEWRVRFTPSEVGSYRVRLAARDRSGRTHSRTTAFEVTPSRSRGFVRISREDPRRFAFDDGTPFVPIGHDVPLGLPDVRACFPKMRAHGEDATYWILCPYDLSFEWDKLGEYDLERAARVDRVFDCARDNGIYLKLSFDVHDALRPSGWWGTNPYNAARGGPCASPNDFYTSPVAWDFYRKRVRYIAARWGYSPHMMAWEPVTELDGATMLDGMEGWGYPKRAGGERISAMLTPFLQRLAVHLKTLDPYGRMFTTSFGGDTSDDAHWSLPEVAYTQIHCYDYADPSDTLSRWARELTGRFAKPMMVTEFGPGTEGPAPGVDPEGINLHNGIWGSLMGGAAGCALNWNWTFVDDFNWYRHYPPLRRFVTGIKWPAQRFRSVDLPVTTPDQGRTMPVTTTIHGRGGFGDVTEERFAVGSDGLLTGAALPPEFLLARGRGERRVCPRFTIEFPRPATFAVNVREVCPDARLEIRLDGRPVGTWDLPAQNVPGKASRLDPTWNLWVCRYDETLAIEVPAGRHEIEVENTEEGGSWTQTRGYAITREEPVALRALALVGESAVLIWVQNRESVWGNWDRPIPAPVQGAQVAVADAPAGRLRVEWMDCWTGKTVHTEQITSRGGEVTLDVPSVTRDLACRLLR